MRGPSPCSASSGASGWPGCRGTAGCVAGRSLVIAIGLPFGLATVALATGRCLSMQPIVESEVVAS